MQLAAGVVLSTAATFSCLQINLKLNNTYHLYWLTTYFQRSCSSPMKILSSLMDMIQETNSQLKSSNHHHHHHHFKRFSNLLSNLPNFFSCPPSKHTPTNPQVPSASSCSSSTTTTTTTTSSSSSSCCCKSQFPKVSSRNFRHTSSHAHPQQTI